MRRRFIVNVTDCIDIAAIELRASVLNALGDDTGIVVEPHVPILPPFSVINANFAVRLAADSYPPETVIFTTINAERVRPPNVIGRTNEKGLIFLGRNMGSFDWLTRDFGCKELYDLGKRYSGESQFRSFEGKLTTAPLAAKAALGVPLAELGDPIPPEQIARLNLPDGTIVHVDNFGMMKFTGHLDERTEGQRYRVFVNDKQIEAVFGRRLMSFETGTWVLFPGSSFGLYELGKVRQVGARELGISVGDILKFERV